MINQLRIANYRSVLNATVTFGSTGLTVVVGANGSGKSNLIKSLQFIASVARNGLEAAMYEQKSMEALLPKSLSTRSLRHALFTLSYDFTLWRPTWYPKDAPPLRITHDILLGRSSDSITRLAGEHLTFENPLLAQFYESHASDSGEPSDASPPALIRHSFLRTSRGSDGKLLLDVSPVFEACRKEYLTWLGLSFAIEGSADMDRHGAEELLASLQKLAPSRSSPAGSVDSWLSLRSPGPFAFCTEANTFRSAIADIRRYDLQLTQLRTEQASSARKALGIDGSGLPAVIRALRDPHAEPESWQRVAATLQALAPHILDAKVSRLKSGKEFIEFVESKAGREVESWESSDGTLRALAILAAVETHPRHGTLLLEEPEQGLHPWAIRILLDHVRDAIVRRDLQVIMTTHSPQVLDNVQPSEVLVASRNPTLGTYFMALPELIPHSQIDMGDVGRLWVRGLLGGVPKYDDF